MLFLLGCIHKSVFPTDPDQVRVEVSRLAFGARQCCFAALSADLHAPYLGPNLIGFQSRVSHRTCQPLAQGGGGGGGGQRGGGSKPSSGGPRRHRNKVYTIKSQMGGGVGGQWGALGMNEGGGGHAPHIVTPLPLLQVERSRDHKSAGD